MKKTVIPKETTMKVVSGTSRALQLLMSNKPLTERAGDYSESAKRVIIASVINPLIEKVEGLKDKIFSLEDFSLRTDLNAGIVAISREDVAARFTKLIDLKFELSLAQVELNNKMDTFNHYFE